VPGKPRRLAASGNTCTSFSR